MRGAESAGLYHSGSLIIFTSFTQLIFNFCTRRRKVDSSASRSSGISTPPGGSKSGTSMRKKKASSSAGKSSGTSKLLNTVPTLVRKCDYSPSYN